MNLLLFLFIKVYLFVILQFNKTPFLEIGASMPTESNASVIATIINELVCIPGIAEILIDQVP